MTQTLLSVFEKQKSPVKEPYKSSETVSKALKNWGFDVTELTIIQYSKETYRAWITGKISDMSEDQQEFLVTMFDLKFGGTVANPHVLIHFRVRRRP